MRSIIVSAMAALTFLSFATSRASALDKCDEARSAVHEAINGKYSEVYKELDDKISQAKSKGVDVSHFPYFDKDNKLQTLNMTSLRNDLDTQKALDISQGDGQVHDQCDKGLQPIQDIVNAAVTVATLGIANVLPKHMTNIDVSQILAGKPLGGENALIPKMRDDALNAIGIGGQNNDIAKVVRDPGRVVKCIFGC